MKIHKQEDILLIHFLEKQLRSFKYITNNLFAIKNIEHPSEIRIVFKGRLKKRSLILSIIIFLLFNLKNFI